MKNTFTLKNITHEMLVQEVWSIIIENTNFKEDVWLENLRQNSNEEALLDTLAKVASGELHPTDVPNYILA